MKVVWTTLAARRVRTIRDTIAEDRPLVAARWLDELEHAVNSLDSFARRGRIVPEYGDPDIREIQLPPYRIIYSIDDDVVTILTVRHGRQRLDAPEG